MKPLHKLSCGEKAYIVDMRNSKFCEFFFELGVFPGDLIEVKENYSNNNSLIVCVNNKNFNIYKKAAETIITNAVSFEINLN